MGNAGVPICVYKYEHFEVHWCRTAAAAVVPLLYCADAFEIQRKVWVGIAPRCVQDGTAKNEKEHQKLNGTTFVLDTLFLKRVPGSYCSRVLQ